MAWPNTPSMAESINTPPQDPYENPFTVQEPERDSEDPNDWEYEYSATETEVEKPVSCGRGDEADSFQRHTM